MPVMRFPGGLAKALTLSYDDGVEQDVRLMELLDRHGIRCTFNLNSGTYPPEGHVWPAGTIHRRMTHSRVKEVYANPNHEVAVHCLTHANLIEASSSTVVYEVMADRLNLEKDFGPQVCGMAYPYGTYNDEVVAALRSCGIKYSRTVESSHQFTVPQDWLRLKPTCHHNDPMLGDLCDHFLKDPGNWSAMVFYLWGHAYEFEANDNWQVIEDFCEKMGGRDDIWYCTNVQLYDYVQAYRALTFSADGKSVYNPTCQRVWLKAGRDTVVCEPGKYTQL